MILNYANNCNGDNVRYGGWYYECTTCWISKRLQRGKRRKCVVLYESFESSMKSGIKHSNLNLGSYAASRIMNLRKNHEPIRYINTYSIWTTRLQVICLKEFVSIEYA